MKRLFFQKPIYKICIFWCQPDHIHHRNLKHSRDQYPHRYLLFIFESHVVNNQDQRNWQINFWPGLPWIQSSICIWTTNFEFLIQWTKNTKSEGIAARYLHLLLYLLLISNSGSDQHPSMPKIINRTERGFFQYLVIDSKILCPDI